MQDEVRAWQGRPLESIYAILYLDALDVRMRDNGHVQNRAVYVAIGVNMQGIKEVLGLWTSANGNRRVKDVFIACADGLKGFPDAIGPVIPKHKCSCA